LLSQRLSNLANLLQSQPGRLAEARELAEEALGIKQTLDPGAAEIWKTYNILAEITDREAAATADPFADSSLPTRPANTAKPPAKPNATSRVRGTRCSSSCPSSQAS
jgi:hypothetical protein